MKFIFKKLCDKSNEFDNTTVTFESRSETLPDILEDFKCFLSACGFPVDFEDIITLEKEGE